MAGEESFLALPKEGHGEGPLRVAQAQADHLTLRQAAVQVDVGFAPIRLRLAGIVLQGDHHLRPRSLLPHVLTDGGLATPEAELCRSSSSQRSMMPRKRPRTGLGRGT